MNRYDKVTEVWLLLHKVEQLIVNDDEYKHIRHSIANCLDRVSTVQDRIESEQ